MRRRADPWFCAGGAPLAGIPAATAVCRTRPAGVLASHEAPLRITADSKDLRLDCDCGLLEVACSRRPHRHAVAGEMSDGERGGAAVLAVSASRAKRAVGFLTETGLCTPDSTDGARLRREGFPR